MQAGVRETRKGSLPRCAVQGREGWGKVLTLSQPQPGLGARRAARAGSLAGGRHRRDAGDLGGVIRPRLQVLQGEE